MKAAYFFMTTIILSYSVAANTPEKNLAFSLYGLSSIFLFLLIMRFGDEWFY